MNSKKFLGNPVAERQIRTTGFLHRIYQIKYSAEAIIACNMLFQTHISNISRLNKI